MLTYRQLLLIVFSSSGVKTYQMFGWMMSMCTIYWGKHGFSAEAFPIIAEPIVA
jgi:hypothetical protein